MVSAVIFDLDGTLVNSSIDFERMKRLTLDRLIMEGVPKDVLSMNLNLVENMEHAREYLESQGDGQDCIVWEEIEDLLKQVEMESLHRTLPIEGVEEALSALSKEGYRMGILTRASRRYAMLTLRSVGIDHLITDMICRDDYPWHEAKPHPLSAARICSRVGVSTDSALMVGDHYIDCLCAMRSGTRFVAVLTGYSDFDMWLEHGVKEVIHSVSDLPEYLSALSCIRT